MGLTWGKYAVHAVRGTNIANGTKGVIMKKITFGVDDKGNVLGEARHRAKLSDADVELIRDIYDEGLASYATLAGVFGVKKATIYDIVNFRRRATTPAAYKTVLAAERKPMPKDRLEQLLGEDNYDSGATVSGDWDEGY